MNEHDSETLEDLELCPMCGHEGFTSGGRCMECGERLIEPEGDPESTDDLPDSQGPNWRLACGVVIMLGAGMLAGVLMIEAFQRFGRDRTLYLLFSTSAGCLALIGVTLFFRGVRIQRRRGDS